MRIHGLSGLLLLAAVGLAGCSRTEVAAPEAAPETARLGDKVDVALADWLALSRSELADKVSEWTVTVAKLQASARENPESPVLLPKLQPPVTLPVYQESHYSPRAGFSHAAGLGARH